MMEWIAAIILVGGFILLLKPFRVIRSSQDVIALSRQVVAILGDKQMSELEKEKAMQRHSLGFLRGFVLILLGGVGAMLVPFGLVWLMDTAGLVSLDNVLLLTMSWPFMIGATLVGIAVLMLQTRSKSTP